MPVTPPVDDDKKIFHSFDTVFDVDGEGDKHKFANLTHTVGVVVDTDDPLQMGRLRIFCPALNDNPKKLLHLPWAAYCSPFGGVVNNACFTRGSDPGNATTKGAVSYGFWAIPEQGAHVLVGCIDGDPRRRYWIGCFPSHQETHTLFNGRFKWTGGDGTPDGPLSSSNDPIQPLYDNLTESFGDRTSPEWRTRGADYQPTAVDQNVGENPSSTKTTYLDEQYEQISAAEPDDWVKEAVGAHGYDWTAFKGLGAFKSSKMSGFSTPGGHSITMDDRPFNGRIKIRTAAGNMVLMDDTNERIYITTSKGNNWMEMDVNGNIDYYCKGRFSVHAENDINFSTDASFRVKAKKGIFMYAGDTAGSPLGDVPADGQVRIQSADDMHIYSNKNIRTFATQDLYFETPADIQIKNANWYQNSSGNIGLQAGTDVSLKAGTKASMGVGSSSVGVNSSSVALNATGDVYLINSTLSGSLTSIDATFKTKQGGSGGGLQSGGGSAITPDNVMSLASGAQISIWTNRVPNHEPWPRTLMQDSNDPVNESNTGYKNNVAWIPQFDNNNVAGRQPIGRVEGDVTIDRGIFWRR
jgi:hypothetical protein